MQKRVNKNKKEIVSDIQLIQDADRRRALIRTVVFPYLVNLGNSIEYTKIFLQAFSGLVEGVYDEARKKTTIGHIYDEVVRKMDSIFDKKDPLNEKEYNNYLGLIDILKDVSIQDIAYANELPRYIDGYITKNEGKKPISEIKIEDILG